MDSPVRLAAFALSLVLCSSVLALEDPSQGDPPGIPPGQEELLLGMLGKDARLPDGCSLENGLVDYNIVEASYKCRFGEVVVELIHASHANPADTTTEFFAISVLEGSASDDLTNALRARIQAREADFEWVDTGLDEQEGEGVADSGQ